MSPRISSPMHPSGEGEMGSEFRARIGGALSVQLGGQSRVREDPKVRSGWRRPLTPLGQRKLAERSFKGVLAVGTV